MAKYNGPFQVIPATGVDGEYATTFSRQARSFDGKISNFGALKFGAALSTDYTQVSSGFKNKDEVQNPSVPSFSQYAERNQNPFVVGSSITKMWRDELRIMTLGSRATSGDSLPKRDITDSKNALASVKDGTMVLNFPAEGYTSFGGRVGGPFDYRVSK